MELQPKSVNEAEKLKKKIATIKKKLARKCRKLQVSEELSKSRVSPKTYSLEKVCNLISKGSRLETNDVPKELGNSVPSPLTSNEILQGISACGQEGSAQPLNKPDKHQHLHSTPNLQSITSELRLVEQIKTTSEVLQKHACQEQIMSTSNPNLQPRVTRNTYRLQNSNLVTPNCSPLNVTVTPLSEKHNTCRSFFPAFPSKVNLSSVEDFVLSKSFTALKLDVVRKGKANISSITDPIIQEKAAPKKFNNLESQELPGHISKCCEHPVEHVQMDSVDIHPTGILRKSELRTVNRKRRRATYGLEKPSEMSQASSWEMEACLHGSSNSHILAVHFTETNVDTNTVDIAMVCQRNKISLWHNTSQWFLLQEITVDEMKEFFFLEQPTSSLVVGVNPGGEACCVVLQQNLQVEYTCLSVWWKSCNLVVGCCSVDSDWLALAGSKDCWLAICYPDLVNASLNILCNMDPVTDVLTALSPINGLSSALVGLSSQMIYIWNVSSGDLISTLVFNRALGVDQCFWATTELGLLYLAIASVVEKCSIFLLLVANPIAQIVATVFEHSKKLRKQNTLFRSMANKDILMTPHGSKEVGAWSMQDMELTDVLKSRQEITSGCYASTSRRVRAVLGFVNGCVHIYGKGEK